MLELIIIIALAAIAITVGVLIAKRFMAEEEKDAAAYVAEGKAIRAEEKAEHEADMKKLRTRS